MNIGQLLKTLIEWLKQWLWSDAGLASQPFVSVREKQYPLGLLKLVEGRTTHQAVRTWIISPTDPTSKDSNSVDLSVPPMDIHIYLDFTSTLKAEQPPSLQIPQELPQASALNPTHTITILKASHRLKRDGRYGYHYIFSGQYDFQGNMATAAEIQARIVCDRLAILRGLRYISDLNWADEVEEIYRQVMGLEGMPMTEAFKFWRLEHSRPTSKTGAFRAMARSKRC